MSSEIQGAVEALAKAIDEALARLSSDVVERARHGDDARGLAAAAHEFGVLRGEVAQLRGRVKVVEGLQRVAAGTPGERAKRGGESALVIGAAVDLPQPTAAHGHEAWREGIDYWIPSVLRDQLLIVLWEMGGEANRTHAAQKLELKLGARFGPQDRELVEVRSGEGNQSKLERWRVRLWTARQELTKKGYLALGENKTVWKLTERGRKYMRAAGIAPKD